MLDRLKHHKGAKRRSKRAGRGPGSGKGRHCGRGIKGQGTRSAGKPTRMRFEGGQMPLTQRLPKRGFRAWRRTAVDIVNLADLARLEAGTTVDPETLKARGLMRSSCNVVKILGNGEAPQNLSVKVHRISAAARQKIESAGGSVELIS